MVRATTRTLLAIALVSLPVLAASAAQTHVPANSTWKLNLVESNFGGGPTMKSDVFTMLVDTPKWASFTDEYVDDSGKTWKWSWSGPANGTMHAATGIPGVKYSTNATDDISEEALPDGTSITCSFSLSEDKKKFTDSCSTLTSDGKRYPQIMVYDLVE